MKRQRYTVGAIVEIPINNGEYYCYGQLLDFGHCAIFDYRSDIPITDTSPLIEASILFRLAIYKQVITQGDWIKVGSFPLREEFKFFPDQYIYHEWNGNFFKYKVESGDIILSSKDECRGLELCAVWDSFHVEDRIKDYYDNVPCAWLKKHYELFQE